MEDAGGAVDGRTSRLSLGVLGLVRGLDAGRTPRDGTPAGAAGRDPVTPLIVGGADATEAYPPVASLQIDRGGVFGHSCGATIVHPRHVVTAAHCVIGDLAAPVDPATLRVRVGSAEHAAGGRVLAVTVVLRPPTADRRRSPDRRRRRDRAEHPDRGRRCPRHCRAGHVVAAQPPQRKSRHRGAQRLRRRKLELLSATRRLAGACGSGPVPVSPPSACTGSSPPCNPIRTSPGSWPPTAASSSLAPWPGHRGGQVPARSVRPDRRRDLPGRDAVIIHAPRG